MGNTYLIESRDCFKRLGSANFSVIDCRFSLADTEWGRQEYSAAHIPGALYAHMDEDLSGPVLPGKTGRHPLPDPEIFMRRLESWGIDKNDLVIIYDQSHGGLAARLWWMLRWVGHQQIRILDGGWSEWCNQGLPVASEDSTVIETRYEGQVNSDMMISMSEIADWSADPTKVLVDARAHPRYTGENEPIDPVAGHIPGANNLPFLENITESGLWKSPSELQLRFSDVMSGSAEDTAVYCGSGVTACHNILALEIAGFHGVRLYPGSWSEWIASGHNAVAVGEIP